MTDRLDAVMLRKYTDGNGETKSASTRIGVAWPLNGGGYRLELEAVPVPTIYEGKVQCSIMLFPPKERDSQSSQQSSYAQQKGRGERAPQFDSGEDDSAIPF